MTTSKTLDEDQKLKDELKKLREEAALLRKKNEEAEQELRKGGLKKAGRKLLKKAKEKRRNWSRNDKRSRGKRVVPENSQHQ